MLRYYLYRHIRQDTNKVFYIGIGSKCKLHNSFKSFTHEYSRAFSHKHRNKHWENIVSKTIYDIDILFETNDINVLKEKEIEFIALYGRKDLGKGTLCNLTDGGDGGFGYVASKETKDKISKALKGKKYGPISEEKRKILSDAHKNKANFPKGCSPLKGRKLSKEHRDAFCTSRLGKKHSEESKQKMSQVLKGKFRSLQAIENNRKAQTGKVMPKETKEKIRKAMLGRTFTSESLVKMKIAAQKREDIKRQKKLNMGVHQAVVLCQRSLDVPETGKMDSSTINVLNTNNPYA